MTVFCGFREAVVVDVETTGFDPATDRIVEIAMIRARFADLAADPRTLDGETMAALVNSERPIPDHASRVHGITDEDVAGKPGFAANARRFRDFIGRRPVVAHNAAFDERFLNAEFARAGLHTLSGNGTYCTMLRFQRFNDGRREGSNLDAAAAAMGVAGRAGDRHGASEDARITFALARLFYAMDNGIPLPDREG